MEDEEIMTTQTYQSSSRTAGWYLWGAGLVCSMLAFATAPLDSFEYPLTATVSLLFFWGFIRSDG